MSEITPKNIVSMKQVVGQRAGGLGIRISMFAIAADYVLGLEAEDTAFTYMCSVTTHAAQMKCIDWN